MSAILVVCHEPLPAGYLLALAPAVSAVDESELAAHLIRASHSGALAVWVDCRLLDTLSASAAWLLWACQQRLRRRHAQLVLCGVSESVAGALRHALAGAAADVPIVANLDAAMAFTSLE